MSHLNTAYQLGALHAHEIFAKHAQGQMPEMPWSRSLARAPMPGASPQPAPAPAAAPAAKPAAPAAKPMPMPRPGVTAQAGLGKGVTQLASAAGSALKSPPGGGINPRNFVTSGASQQAAQLRGMGVLP